MDDKIKIQLEQMEARLMTRINALHETMLDGFRRVDSALHRIETTLAARTALPNLIAGISLDHGKRITGLQNKPPPVEE